VKAAAEGVSEGEEPCRNAAVVGPRRGDRDGLMRAGAAVWARRAAAPRRLMLQERVRTKGPGPRGLAAAAETGGAGEKGGGGRALPRSRPPAGWGGRAARPARAPAGRRSDGGGL